MILTKQTIHCPLQGTESIPKADGVSLMSAGYGLTSDFGMSEIWDSCEDYFVASNDCRFSNGLDLQETISLAG